MGIILIPVAPDDIFWLFLRVPKTFEATISLDIGAITPLFRGTKDGALFCRVLCYNVLVHILLHGCRESLIENGEKESVSMSYLSAAEATSSHFCYFGPITEISDGKQSIRRFYLTIRHSSLNDCKESQDKADRSHCM